MLAVYFAGAKGFEKCPAMRDHMESRDLKAMFLVGYSRRASFIRLWHSKEIQVVHYHLQSIYMLQCCLKPMVDPWDIKMQVSFFSIQNFLNSLMEDTASKKESETKAPLRDYIFRVISLKGQKIFHTVPFTSNLFFPDNIRQWVTSRFMRVLNIEGILKKCSAALPSQFGPVFFPKNSGPAPPRGRYEDTAPSATCTNYCSAKYNTVHPSSTER